MLTTVTLPFPPPADATEVVMATAAPHPPLSQAQAETAASPHRPPGPGDCSLLGPFAILVQLALGALALLSLVWKRWRERPQRPVRIWFFDVSKQVFGGVLVHAANVFMSLLTSGRFSIEAEADVVAATAVTRLARRAVNGVVRVGLAATGLAAVAKRDGEAATASGDGEEYVPNPCSFYLLNLAIDTTIGIPILIVIVRALTYLVSLTPLGKPLESIQSGNYGNPPNAWWWLKQSVIYFCGLMGMKLCVLFIFMALPWLPHVGDWALGWTEGNEELQIVFVMMLFPLIMNAMQYYIIDSYIKKQETGSHASSASSGASNARPSVAYEELRPGTESDSETDGGEEDGDGDDSSARKSLTHRRTGSSRSSSHSVRGTHVRLARRDSAGVPGRSSTAHQDPAATEYDPNVDGDTPTVVGSSSSRRSSRRSLPKAFNSRE
ncbi:hypothetical protein VTJ83DRAFT_660 [Remersonia thermophila]|uniref:Vacuolar membrane protein n=1 Tax=Remersonia thermophila TaxID=72144 RepID=A0ABR4DP12_9PEZI